jgi:Mrp family chromosome partitioning ATPase/capsular polysaccharide biosynthesis protein
MDFTPMNDTTNDAPNIFGAIWQRKWLILAVAILVAAGTYEYYKHASAVYRATTQLFLGGASEQATLSGAGGKPLTGRVLADQVGLINSTLIGKPARELVRGQHDLVGARAKAVAAVTGTSDFITITTEAPNPRSATDLANAYAQVYISRERKDYVSSIRKQIENARAQLRRVETPPPGAGKGSKSTASSSTTLQAANLASKISQLEAGLSTFAGVQQVSPAKAQPLPVTPSPKRNAIFGFVLGLVLASVAAYALGRFDRRIRRLEDVETTFHTSILAALPAVKSPVIRPRGERAPAKPLLEPLRRLQTALQLGDPREPVARERRPRVLLFVSPDAGDGRSSVIANLARVQSESGERVVVVEADFRRPVQARLMNLSGSYGLADVLAGKVPVAEAMQSAKIAPELGGGSSDAAAAAPAAVSTVVESSRLGALSVLAGGGTVTNPPALLASSAMAELLRTLTDEFDYVLIDAPPPLEVSDAMPLLPLVDGIVLVGRIAHTREVFAQRLAQLLGRTASAPVLGAVVNCVPRRDMERFGFSFAPVRQRRKLVGR